MNESMHGPTIVAAMIRAAYEEGAREQAPNGDDYSTSAAKKSADQILKNAGDPTLMERFFGLFRAWSNAEDFKKASALMTQMRELAGPAPFDGGGKA